MLFFEASVQILQKVIRTVSPLWLFGVLPVLTLAYVAAAVFVIWFHDDVGSARMMRAWKRNSAAESLCQLSTLLKKSTFHTTVAVAAVGLLLGLNAVYDQTAPQIQENAGSICSIILGLTTIAVTVAAAIILLNKTYYLTFSIQEVLRSYHFTECIGYSIASCLTACIAGMLLLSFTTGTAADRIFLLLLEGSVLFNLGSTAGCLYITYKIMFSGDQIELKLLDRLNRIFWASNFTEDSGISSAEDWSFSAIRPNVEYLCAGYVTAARKLPIQNAQGLYGTVPGRAEETGWIRRADRIRRWLLISAAGLYLLSLLFCFLIPRKYVPGMLLLDTVSFLIILAVLLLKNSPIHSLFDRLQVQVMGYSLVMKKRTVLISRTSETGGNRYKRFTLRMNNLIAFFVLALQQGVERETVDSALDLVLDWLSDIGEQDRNAVLYLPVFTIGYFADLNGIRPEALPPLYRSLEPDPSADSRTAAMITDQVLYLTQSASEENHAERLDAYLRWLTAEPASES